MDDWLDALDNHDKQNSAKPDLRALDSTKEEEESRVDDTQTEKTSEETAPVRCEFLVPVFWGLGTVVFRVVGTGPRGTSARAVSLSRLGWSGRWLYACRSLRYGFGGRC